MKFFDTDDLFDSEIYLSLIETCEAIPERKWVACYKFNICKLNNEIVGHCNLKIDNSELTKYCGNIGYGVDKKHRGKKYSARASKLLLKLAKKHDLKYVFITCAPNNIASNKICQLLNAEFIETVDVPQAHEMSQEYDRLNIYKIELK